MAKTLKQERRHEAYMHAKGVKLGIWQPVISRKFDGRRS